jgi:hypothetical protein
MNLRSLPLAVAALLTLANAPPVPEIVVSGARTPEREVAETYVAQVAGQIGGQIARFHDPVCPAVVGLPPRHARFVEGRIRAAAAAAGAPVARSHDCRANLLVMLAADGKALVEDIVRRRSGWIDGLDPQEVRRLRKAPGPVWNWAVTSLRNEDGQGLGVHGSDTEGARLRVHTASYLSTTSRQHIDGSLLVIAKSAAEGMTLDQIADFAAMRGLAGVKQGAIPGQTILNLFSDPPDMRARAMSATDSAYLAALYSGEGTLSAVKERGRLAERMARPGN